MDILTDPIIAKLETFVELHLLCCFLFQDSSIRLIALDKFELQEAQKKINAFITEKMQISQHIVCKSFVGRFISKHYVSDNLEVSKGDRGLFIRGPETDVNKCELREKVKTKYFFQAMKRM